MIRRVPIFATLVVLLAVGVMIRLGFWQLDRLGQKEALIARYQAAQAMSADIPWPITQEQQEQALYRHSSIDCLTLYGLTTVSGRNAHDEPGLAVEADCELPGGARALVVLGWARQPPVRQPWTKGEVRGIVAPGPRLVADPPLAGLQASARPDPKDIPNNHLAYAVQWFLFAATALVIYAIALRKRLRG